MAVTKIWSIKGRIKNVLSYAMNPEKTKALSGGELEALHDAVAYAADEYKTEKLFYVSALNCELDKACEQMLDTKKEYAKTGGIVAFHGLQSFAPGEVTPDLAHHIGCELARRLWGERFEVVVATHMNTDAVHNHFVVNSVSCVDGKKFYASKRTYEQMRDESDELCRRHGLCVVTPSAHGKGKNYREYTAEKNGAYTKNSIIKRDIDECIAASVTIQQFFSAMNSRGYRINDAHKYVTVTHAAFPKARRLNSLGAGYTQDDIVSRISNKWTAKTADIPEQERIETVFPNDGIKTTDGKLELQGIYTWFSCGLQIVYNRPNTNRALQYMLNDELLKLDKIISETNLLTDNRIETSEQLEQFRSSTQAEMTELTDARRVLRNKLKAAARADDTAECEQLRSYIELASERIKKLHKDMAACESIAERTPRLESRMLQIEEATRLQREVRKGEQRRRCSRTDRANES